LKKYLPITYWTFLVGTLAIAGFPLLSGFFSKDEILWKTYTTDAPSFHLVLYVVALITAFLTATYMFRLLFMTFHGERRTTADHGDASHMAPKAASMTHAAHDHGHGHGHAAPHDAPPSMAFALIVLAVGSLLAGYVGVPHALGGENRIETFLHPSFTVAGAAHEEAGAAGAAGEHHADTQTELMLMGLSVGVGLAGIGLAWFFWYRNPENAAAMQRRFRPVHRLLLNKYYVDELYDAAVVQPVKVVSEEALWRGVDTRVVDGAVNGAGQVVGGMSAVMRLLQSGSVKAYAASTFFGVVAILAYYLWR
jgi:NADH-quinone oxidoreductase subunit L